jgi:hypothetical protein
MLQKLKKRMKKTPSPPHSIEILYKVELLLRLVTCYFIEEVYLILAMVAHGMAYKMQHNEPPFWTATPKPVNYIQSCTILKLFSV